MKRRNFLNLISLMPITINTMNLREFNNLTSQTFTTRKMPLLFVGHGSPMNAVEENEFVEGWRKTAQALERPIAILCISAHWETKGTFVTAMHKPKTIHDFGGFPKELYDVQYPAPGNPDLANETKKIITSTEVGLDKQWGLDHGCWSVVKHLYPNADIPVIQMSIDYSKPLNFHYELAKELSSLRKKGILIMGSGNMVHNLRKIDWQNADNGYDWAIEANEGFKKLILENNSAVLNSIQEKSEAYSLSVPTPEHYIPLLYIMGLKKNDENISFFNDKTVMGSISMTSVKVE